jgi:hypothetical protein
MPVLPDWPPAESLFQMILPSLRDGDQRARGRRCPRTAALAMAAGDRELVGWRALSARGVRP